MKIFYSLFFTVFCLAAGLTQSVRTDWPVINGDPSRTSNAFIELSFPLEVTDTIAFNFGNEGGTIIWEDKVFFGTTSSTNDIQAADLMTGDSLWTFTVTGSTGSIQCTPAASHGIVVAGGQNGDGLFGLNAYTGEVLWLAPVFGLYTRSPMIFDSMVYVATYGGLTCFDLFTGDTIWTHEEPTPQITAAVDSQGVYYNAGGVIYARDRRTGEELWSNASVENGHVTNYMVDSSLLYVGHKDTISALLLENGEVLWQTALDTNEEVYFAGLAALTDSLLILKTVVDGSSSNHYRVIHKLDGSIINSYTYGQFSWSAPTVINGYMVDCGYSKLTFLDMITGDSVYAVRGLQFGQCPSQVIAVKDMIVVVGQFREIYILKSQSTGIAPVQADFEVNVSPNPAHAVTYADIHLSRASSVSMRVLTLEGKSVNHHKPGFLQEGKHRISVPLDGLASGIYVLQVQTERGIVTKKFIVH